MQLPTWMYRQIIYDDTAKAVWCFCGAPAISYCNGSQFVCDGAGHFGMPMVTLKPRAEQYYLNVMRTKARDMEEAKTSRKARRTATKG